MRTTTVCLLEMLVQILLYVAVEFYVHFCTCVNVLKNIKAFKLHVTHLCSIS